MLFQAIDFSTKAHRGQFRKASGVPYIYHPLSVAKILIELGCSEELVVAGILHDTVEDTSVTLHDIHVQFGERVAYLVESVSEPDKSAAWEIRKQHTIAFLEDAPMDVLLIACADKLDNARSLQNDLARMGEALWQRFNRPKASQSWYYYALVDVLSRRATEEPLISLVKQLNAIVTDIFSDPLNNKKNRNTAKVAQTLQ